MSLLWEVWLKTPFSEDCSVGLFQLRLISVLVHVTVGVSDLMFLVH